MFRSQRRNLIYGTSKAKRPPCCWFGGTQSFGHFFLVEKIPNNFHGFLSFQLFTYQLLWSHHELIIKFCSLMSMKLIYNFAILAREIMIVRIVFVLVSEEFMVWNTNKIIKKLNKQSVIMFWLYGRKYGSDSYYFSCKENLRWK